MGESACSHHTFAHTKVFASVLEHQFEKIKIEKNKKLSRAVLEGVNIQIKLNNRARYIVPLVSQQSERLEIKKNKLTIYRMGGEITLEVKRGVLNLPYEEERIYNLIPGLQALKTKIIPINEEIIIHLKFKSN